MPRLGPADIRLRNAQGNVRASVDVAGHGASASARADVSTDGVVAADVQGNLHRDAFDANVSAHADRSGANASASVALPGHDADGNMSVRAGPDGLGLRTHARIGRVSVDAGADRRGRGDDASAHGFAGVRLGGPDAGAGVTLHAQPDGISVHTDIDVGPADLDIDVDASGRVSAALDVGGEMVDGLDVRIRARRRDDKTALGGATAFRLSRFLALPDVKIEGETEKSDPTAVVPDESRAGKLRSAVLSENPDATYEKKVVHRYVKGGAERKLPLGVAGAELGFSGGRDLRLTTIRLHRGDDPSDLGPDAEQLATMLPGERFELAGQARMSLQAEARGELSPLATRMGTSLAIRSEMIRDGNVRVVVDKEEDDWARVRLHRKNTTDGGGEQGLHVGPALPLSGAKLNHFVADLAFDYARSWALDWMQNMAPLHATRKTNDRDDEILEREFRVDLSQTDVRDALDHAIGGDWTKLDSMAGQAGVRDLRRVMENRQTDREERSIRAFGLSRTHANESVWSQRHELTSTGTESVSERSWKRSKEWRGWLGHGRREMGYLEKETTQHAGPAHVAVDGQHAVIESVIEWNSEQKLKAAGPRQLERALGMAMLLGESDICTNIRAEIQSRQAGVSSPGHVHADVADAGTENDTLRVSLRVDDDGIHHAASLSADLLWQYAAEAWFALHPGQEPPVWTKDGGRASLETFGPLRHGHVDYAPYHEVRVCIDTLMAAKGKPKHEVMRTLRDHLEARAHDPFWVAFLAKAVGPAHRQLSVQVDESPDSTPSTAADGGS